MIHDRDFEGMLHAALRRRGASAPFAVDVADRVMARIAEIGPAPRAELGPRQLGRWAAAAAVAAVTLTAALISMGPSPGAVAESVGQAIAVASGAALKLAAPAAALIETLGRIVSACVASAQALVRPLAPFQPVAQALLATIAAAMLGITTFVVGRDVSRRGAPQEHA